MPAATAYADLVSLYRHHISVIEAKVKADGNLINMGRVQWREVQGIPAASNVHEVFSDVVPCGSGRFLMSDE